MPLPLGQSRARAVDGARTRTQRIKSPLLCHSSYDGEVDAEGIEPSSDGLRIRCPAIRRRIRMRRLSRTDESRRLRFLAATILLSKTINPWGRAESNRLGRATLGLQPSRSP